MMLIFLAIVVPYWVSTGWPQANAMLKGIIPSLSQQEQLSLEQGFKAIHVKISPGSTPTLYEFHPTNQGALGTKHYSHAEIIGSSDPLNYQYYFFLKTWKNDKCTLFATGDTGIVTAGGWPDMYVYYFNSGAQIRKTDTSLKDSLFPYLSDSGCDKNYGCNVPGQYTVCANSEVFARATLNCDSKDSDLMKQKFGTTTDNKCVADQQGCPSINGKQNCCALAASVSNQQVYEPAYNILCGYEQGSGETDWYACTPQQYATVGTESGGAGTQFSCSGGVWNVKSGSGVYLKNPQIKYNKGSLGDDDTTLKFSIANYESEKQNAEIKATVTNSDKNCNLDKESLTKDCGTVAANSFCEYNSEKIDYYGNLCNNAKTFDVSFAYAGGSESFKIECKNADINNGDWQNCTSTGVLGNLYNIGASFSQTCGAKKYDINYEAADSVSVLLDVKENGVVVKQGLDLIWRIVKGTPETINNLKVTLYDLSAVSPYAARIGADCI